MFNIGSAEFAVIAVAALLILGPKRLPELARGIGKFLREFRRQTDEVKNVVEREFYRMDQDLSVEDPPASPALSSEPAPAILPAEGAVSSPGPEALATPAEPALSSTAPVDSNGSAAPAWTQSATESHSTATEAPVEASEKTTDNVTPS